MVAKKNSALREVWETIKETGSDWSNDNASRLAAALAFYAVLALAPLLMIAVAVAGFFLGTDAARDKVAAELGGIVGGDAAESVHAVAVASAESPTKGVFGTIVGIVALFFGASGVFYELQSSLNTVWEVKPKPGGGIWSEVRNRFFSFTMVLSVAFLLLVSLVLTSLLSAAGTFFSELLPGGETLLQVMNFCISGAIVAGLFAMIFKYIPDATISWRDVWLGGVVTAVLFTIGKFAIGVYFGKAAVGSAYGAAGSIIALVVWVYYAAQIFLLGAEFTQVQARRSGRRIEPSEGAVAMNDDGAVGQPRHLDKVHARQSAPSHS